MLSVFFLFSVKSISMVRCFEKPRINVDWALDAYSLIFYHVNNLFYIKFIINFFQNRRRRTSRNVSPNNPPHHHPNRRWPRPASNRRPRSRSKTTNPSCRLPSTNHRHPLRRHHTPHPSTNPHRLNHSPNTLPLQFKPGLNHNSPRNRSTLHHPFNHNNNNNRHPSRFRLNTSNNNSNINTNPHHPFKVTGPSRPRRRNASTRSTERVRRPWTGSLARRIMGTFRWTRMCRIIRRRRRLWCAGTASSLILHRTTMASSRSLAVSSSSRLRTMTGDRGRISTGNSSSINSQRVVVMSAGIRSWSRRRPSHRSPRMNLNGELLFFYPAMRIFGNHLTFHPFSIVPSIRYDDCISTLR